jgi:hypothetical protein
MPIDSILKSKIYYRKDLNLTSNRLKYNEFISKTKDIRVTNILIIVKKLKRKVLLII